MALERTGPLTRDTSTVALGLAQIRLGNASAFISSRSPVFGQQDSMGALGSTKFTSTVEQWKLESGFPKLEDMSIPVSEVASMECSFKEITPKNLAIARGLNPFEDVSSTSKKGSVASAAGTVSADEIAVTNDGGVVDDVWTVVFASATSFSVYGAATGHVGDHSDLSTAFAPDNSGNPYFSIPANFFTGTWEADDTFTFSTTAFVAGTAAYADNHTGEIKLGAMKAPEFIRMEAVYTYPNGVNHMYIIFPRANVSMSAELDLQDADAATSPITFEAKRADSGTAGGHASWDDAPLGVILFD